MLACEYMNVVCSMVSLEAHVHAKHQNRSNVYLCGNGTIAVFYVLPQSFGIDLFGAKRFL